MEGGLVIHVMFSQKLSGPPPPFDALIQSSSWDLLPVHFFSPAASASFNFFNFFNIFNFFNFFNFLFL